MEEVKVWVFQKILVEAHEAITARHGKRSEVGVCPMPSSEIELSAQGIKTRLQTGRLHGKAG